MEMNGSPPVTSLVSKSLGFNNWAGAPYKAQQVIRRILNEQYSSRVNGLPGNDDLGSMGAWYVFASIGLFPEIPGVGGFSVNSPVFRKIVLHLPEGDVIIKGGDEKKEYIHSLSLDGKKMEGTWIDWSDLYGGRPWNIIIREAG